MDKIKNIRLDMFELILLGCIFYIFFYIGYLGIDEFELAVYNLVDAMIS